jgi:hypothetical protein
MNLLAPIRKKKAFKILAAYLALSMLAEIVMPLRAFALTSGPAQPEFASFEPMSTSEMVDMYSGDFTYNIPLLSVPGPNGGYPINLAYHAGIGMDEEASWVGLGWNVNVGAINRQLRGVPDDFQGDVVKQKWNLLPSVTVGLDMKSRKLEKNFGKQKNSFSNTLNYQLYYNTYRGIGNRFSSDSKISNKVVSVGAGLSLDSQTGVGVEPSLNIGKELSNKWASFSIGVGLQLNSRAGLVATNVLASGSMMIAKPKMVGGNEHGNGMLIGATGFGNYRGSTSFQANFGVPQVQIPMRNLSFPFDVSQGLAGGELLPAFSKDELGSYEANLLSQRWNGFYTQSTVSKNQVEHPAYGYWFHASAFSSSDPEACYTDLQHAPYNYNMKTPMLPVSNMTYDMYSITGQGTGMHYRPYTNQVQIPNVSSLVSKDLSISLNAEKGDDIGLVSLYSAETHLGIGAAVGWGKTQSGPWQQVGTTSDVSYASTLAYNMPNNERSFESVYNRATGEMNGEFVDDDWLNKWSNDQAVRATLKRENADGGWKNQHFVAENNFISSANASGFQASITNNAPRSRVRRANNIENITTQDAFNYGLTRNTGYTMGASQWTPIAKNFLAGHIKSHHTSEISVLQPDGMRYVYGLPAYNKLQREANFAVEYPTDLDNYLVTTKVSGNAIDVNGTWDHYYAETELPPYAHSWMLTAVVSADYIDLSNNGPTDDDYGYWVKFNYEKKSDDYHWRVPYAEAVFNPGSVDNKNDDKGSILYGEKELFYLSSIETKTHIAVFSLSPRQDGFESHDFVKGQLPGIKRAAGYMHKLDKISLYTKREFFKNTNGDLNAGAVAINTVQFRYSYRLCPNVPNNIGASIDASGFSVTSNSPNNVNINKGKLTLDRVFFTNETSSRGQLSPYVFDYGTTTIGSPDNPSYDQRNMDRWGAYKDNSLYTGAGSSYPWQEMPYTQQEIAPHPEVWSLKSVKLPTGATMAIEYEADDYSYVENKRAQRMFDIVGTQETVDQSKPFGIDRLTTTPQVAGLDHATQDYRIYFKLDQPQISNAGAAAYITQNYLDNGKMTNVYFKVLADLKGVVSNQHYDYVSGYANIVVGANGFAKSANSVNYDLGYITLSPVSLSEWAINTQTVNPILRAAIEHVHYNRPEIANTPLPQTNSPWNQIVNLVSYVGSVSNDIANMAMDYNVWANQKGFGEKIKLNGNSVIRLCDSDSRKFAGGLRVKAIRLSGTWTNGATNDHFEYGQTYSYTMEDDTSSGVAYEPYVGGDEDALRTPINYINSRPITSAQHLFVETPVMSSYYPGASVGYRRVVVESTAPEKAQQEDANNSLFHSAAPLSVYEFYSPKDFPLLFDKTDMTSDPKIIRPVTIPGIYSNFKQRVARSQGYSIVTNDMAGRPKSITLRTRSLPNGTPGSLISKITYVYQTEKPYDPNQVNKLDNKVQAIVPDGNGDVFFRTAVIGQTQEMFMDMNENLQKDNQVGIDFNYDTKTPPQLFFLMPLIHWSKTEASQRTAVMHKIIHRSGILKQTIVQHEESTVVTENLGYDIETGKPLLTQVTNEFHDNIFALEYPAHWYYDALKGSYLNSGVRFSGVTMAVGSNGRIVLPTLPVGKQAKDYFAVGDEVYVKSTALSIMDGRYTVVKLGADGSGNPYIDLITTGGTFIGASLSSPTVNSIVVIRSGHRNLQSVMAGAVSAKAMNGFVAYDRTNPSTVKQNPIAVNPDKILNASAVEFSDIWQTECTECGTMQTTINSVANPYRNGILGQWRPFRSYAYLTGRTQTGNTREDGYLTDFQRFHWENVALNLGSKWTSATEITKYSPHSFELENKDALGNFSAALYEFDNILPTAIAGNARYREIAFDAYEDYARTHVCQNQLDHWGFAGTSVLDTVRSQAHTGKYSLRVLQNGSTSITRLLPTVDCDAYQASRRAQVINPTDLSQAYNVNECDCIGKFAPITGKQYVLSTWVKQTGQLGPLTAYAVPQMRVEAIDANSVPIATVTLSASGKIVEGWQRIFGTFQVPAGTASLKVTFVNNAGAQNITAYFDDVRIHPFDANMVTYVYDPVTLRLVAELDANNFATFYYYDSEGRVSVIKKETAEGIKTIQEGRASGVTQ